MNIRISAPDYERYDPDNVALFVCDLMTIILGTGENAVPVDQIVDRVIITHEVGEPLVDIEIGPMEPISK